MIRKRHVADFDVRPENKNECATRKETKHTNERGVSLSYLANQPLIKVINDESQQRKRELFSHFS